MPGPPDIPRTVKPRKSAPKRLPIIAYNETGVYVERLDTLFPAQDLPQIIVTEPTSIFACQRSDIVLWELEQQFAGSPKWRRKTSQQEREVWKPNRKVVRKRIQLFVHYFGFNEREEGGRKKTSRYFYPLDPLVFHNLKTIADLRKGSGESELEALFRWAKQIREWAFENELRVSTTAGGLASQLLRDKRFYPNPRRKVPKDTNIRGRVALPGNFYRLYDKGVDQLQEFKSVIYLDQKNAHHSAASELEFPDADYLMARGQFRKLPTDIDALENFKPKPWLKRGQSGFDRIKSNHRGLFYCRIYSPGFKGQSFHLPCMDRKGFHDCFLFSNEIFYLESFRGAYVDCFYAAWSTDKIEHGLNRYAEWAIQEIEEAKNDPYRKDWLKPVLLATYGVLASKPRHIEFGFNVAKKGTPYSHVAGPFRLDVLLTKTKKEIEFAIANAIHRGMIEAETRIESLGIARWLHSKGFRVIAVYADSVLLNGEYQSADELPTLPPPWSIQDKDIGKTIFPVEGSPVHIVSDRLIKRPGTPKTSPVVRTPSRRS